MKKFIFLFLAIFVVVLTHADGWRDGEKQVIVTINSIEEAEIIADLKVKCF